MLLFLSSGSLFEVDVLVIGNTIQGVYAGRGVDLVIYFGKIYWKT